MGSRERKGLSALWEMPFLLLSYYRDTSSAEGSSLSPSSYSVTWFSTTGTLSETEFVQSRIQSQEQKVLHSFIASNIKTTYILFENISMSLHCMLALARNLHKKSTSLCCSAPLCGCTDLTVCNVVPESDFIIIIIFIYMG